MDDETPRLTVNTGLKLERKETKVITTRNLKAVDLDSDDKNLMYILMTKPALGHLQKVESPNVVRNLMLGDNFTQKDIKARKVR